MRSGPVTANVSQVEGRAKARIHRCGAALGLEQGVRAVGRDGPRSIPINVCVYIRTLETSYRQNY